MYASLMPNPRDLTHIQVADKVEHAVAHIRSSPSGSCIYAKNRVRWTIGITFMFLASPWNIPAHDPVSHV